MKGCHCIWLICNLLARAKQTQFVLGRKCWKPLRLGLTPKSLINVLFITLAILSRIHNANWMDSNPQFKFIPIHKCPSYYFFNNNSIMVCDILKCMFCSSIILYLCWRSLWCNCGVEWFRAHTVEHGLVHYFLGGLEGFHVSFSKGKVHEVIIILLFITICFAD